MPKKAKIRSINVSKKWKTWYIKSESKTSIVLIYCGICFHIIILSLCQLSYVFLGKCRVETKFIKYISGNLTDNFLSGPPEDHLLLASHTAEPHPTDQISLDLKKSLNLNIASYFINTLAYPNANTWHHRGGPNKHKIDRFGINPNHRQSV